jgi:chitin deacetylase
MKRIARIVGIVGMVLVSILLLSYGLFQISKSRTFQFFGEITARVETDKKVVALTFDDAPSEFSNEVVEILAEKNIVATFYIIGNNIETHPEHALTIVNAGHEMGNHSYSHPRFYLKSQGNIDLEIQKTNQLIRDSGYTDVITFRPPYGKKLFGLPWYLSRHDIHTVMWDVEPETYTAGMAEGREKTKAIVDYTVSQVEPGSIILLHPFCKTCSSSRAAIPGIIDTLIAQGYTFVTVSELIK